MYTYIIHNIQGIGSGQYILPPGVTLPKHLVPCKPSPSLTNLDDFLYSQSRQRHCVLGDGNCMFRAISHQLYATEDHHAQLRQCLCQSIEQNKINYEVYWIDSSVSYTNHLQQLMHQGSWGTQLELKAISDYLSVPLFLCSPHVSTRAYRWVKYAPSLSTSRQDMTLPPFTLPFTVNHIEIAHSSTEDHFDSVTPYNASSPSLQVPMMTPGIVATITLA